MIIYNNPVCTEGSSFIVIYKSDVIIKAKRLISKIIKILFPVCHILDPQFSLLALMTQNVLTSLQEKKTSLLSV